MTRLYVGNLAYSVSDGDLRSLFAQFGTVVSARVVLDRETLQTRGFGFVEMASSESAQASLALHETELAGRRLIVTAARPQSQRFAGRR